MTVSRRLFAFALVVIAFSMTAAGAADAPSYIRHFPRQGGLRFTIHDDINSPVYSWPRTLLSYPVDFSDAALRPENVQLVDPSTTTPVPMQLSDIQLANGGALKSARVSFFSDLPPGATHTWELRAGPPVGATEKVSEVQSAGVIEVDAGSLKVRLPKSCNIHAGDLAPGPILAINTGKGWIGSSQILSPHNLLQHIETEEVDAGDLFRSYRLTYRFTNGATYVATVRAVLNYPVLEFHEAMTGFTDQDAVQMVMAWDNFSPTKRFAGNGWHCGPDGIGIDEPVTVGGSMEEPHWTPLDYAEDPAVDMVYHLASYQGNAPRDATPVMSFWDDRPSGQELSIFVPEAKTWDDRQYMVWQPTTRLQIHFRYTDHKLYWTFPLLDGTRGTDLSLHDAGQGVQSVEDTRQKYSALGAFKTKFATQGTLHQLTEMQLRYAQLLRSWYGTLSLDHVKDWVLTYPAGAKTAPSPFGVSAKESANDLENRVVYSYIMTYPLGLDLVAMSINHRVIRPIVELYTRVGSQLSPEQRKRVDALLLLSSYVNAAEDMAPIRTCASGTPNISADGFSVPAEIGILYPDHPMGPEWRDQFEKTIDLMACFFTRPDVPALGSLGGRWCESLSVYNWAYLTPTLVGQTAITLTDGRNRFANPYMALRGRWLVDELSAPIFNPDPYWRQNTKRSTVAQAISWNPGDALSTQAGFERQYVPHGAHGSGTGIPIPLDQVPVLGTYLAHFDPLIAEHLFWAAAQGSPQGRSEGGGTEWGKWEMNRIHNSGTNPHLASSKYTGQGLILRAGVGTPEELSVHLEQVDAGPNYRWGNNGQGSSGTLYFYAGGKVWSGHERENTGDHQNDDTTGNTNFGVVSRGAFRTIGENVLDHPLYDLAVAQYAQINARTGPSAYSWPAYKSRSVMLVGTDYFVLVDDVAGDGQGATRFSWFNAKDLPFPKLVFLQPTGVRTDAVSTVHTQMSKGILRDGSGPSVVLVSHKLQGVDVEDYKARPQPGLEADGIQEYLPARGGKSQPGVYHVKTPTSRDLLFRAVKPITYDQGDQSFTGTAGVIRTRPDGQIELALLQGTSIKSNGVTIAVPANSGVGVGATFKQPSEITGYFVAPQTSECTLTFAVPPAAASIYIDGERQSTNTQSVSLKFQIPAGRHQWQVTSHLPTPAAPIVQRTENAADGASVFFNSVAGAQSYRIELSRDGGTTWTAANTNAVKTSPASIAGLHNNEKVHVRVVAVNADHESEPSHEYPVYVSNQPPSPPDGLWLELSPDRVDVSWGQLLGVNEYRLYRRPKAGSAGSDSKWTQIYSGLGQSTSDSVKGVVSAAIYPGQADNVSFASPAYPVFEYAVAAVNGNGEGPKSYVADTDPTSWRNWWPANQPRQFKRQTGYWLPPYVSPDVVPPMNYPTAR